MKVKSGFILHAMGEEYVVVAVEERTREFSGMIRLNGTGAFLWERMQKPFVREDLVEALCERYEVTRERAAESVALFLEPLCAAGIFEE